MKRSGRCQQGNVPSCTPPSKLSDELLPAAQKNDHAQLVFRWHFYCCPEVSGSSDDGGFQVARGRRGLVGCCCGLRYGTSYLTFKFFSKAICSSELPNLGNEARIIRQVFVFLMFQTADKHNVNNAVAA
jgi:hypothetical protein